ncbi:MAG: HAD hydrolase-like protein [Chloroflexota bacterium]
MAPTADPIPRPAILIDLDGTIGDPREGIVRCIEFGLRRLGRTPRSEHELLRFIGPPLYESFSALLNSSDRTLIRRAVALYRERFATTWVFENTAYPDIPAVLDAQHPGGYPPYVVTSKAAVCALDSINHLLRVSEWKRTFRSVVCHLNHDGLFIFDVNTLGKFKHLSAGTAWEKWLGLGSVCWIACANLSLIPASGVVAGTCSIRRPPNFTIHKAFSHWQKISASKIRHSI